MRKMLAAWLIILSLFLTLESLCLASDCVESEQINFFASGNPPFCKIWMDVNAFYVYDRILASQGTENEEQNFIWSVFVKQSNGHWKQVLGYKCNENLDCASYAFYEWENMDYICKFQIIFEDGSHEEIEFSVRELFNTETKSLELNGVELTLCRG